MNNKFTDLNDHLMAQIERLGDESLSGKELASETKRAHALSNVSSQAIKNGRLILEAAKLQAELTGRPNVPQLGIGIEEKDNLKTAPTLVKTKPTWP